MRNSFEYLKSLRSFSVISFEFECLLFFSGLISNIAAKYGLSRAQITVSSVEDKGLASFQIMPFFNENMEEFEKKMDQIDIDV